MTVVFLLTAGCRGDETAVAVRGEQDAPPASLAADAGEVEVASDVEPAATTNDPVVAFVAAFDEAMVDTAYAGEVLESPEVFVATAALFCERLSEGVSPDVVLGDYVEVLTGATSAVAADDDELVLAGSLLGVGVGTLCPEHTELLEGPT